MERTFIAIKPDGVHRGLVGTIIGRLEAKGFNLVAMKMLQVSPELAAAHYAEHQGKPFFNGLIQFITSAPVVAMVWEGPGVIASARKVIGATDPLKAEPGTIRGDYGVNLGRNLIHGSDGPESAQREIDLWFKPEERFSWDPALKPWLIES